MAGEMDLPAKGGFSFDLCRRNAMLAEKGLKMPGFRKTETTIVGLVFQTQFNSEEGLIDNGSACMTWELAKSGVHFITTIINGADLVPTFSSASVDDLRSEYLQNKGLCLMPVAVASAVSNQKGVATAAIPPES
ncbi:hypothetical protein ABZP36_001337 [Zizania latifolia]